MDIKTFKMTKILNKTSNQITQMFINLYTNKRMSGQEISNWLFNNYGIKLTARSIQRRVKKYNKTRNIKKAFNLAIQKGRVKWRKKTNKITRIRLSNKLRYKILKRDNFRCVLCGRKPPDVFLEVDHIKRIKDGGKHIESNLRTLCNLCNNGRK